MALREPLADPRPYGVADATFGLNTLGAWCRADPRANLVLSPSSLASGLGMAYLGARGDTAQAMAATFCGLVGLTAMPDGPSSVASVWVSRITAAFAAQ